MKFDHRIEINALLAPPSESLGELLGKPLTERPSGPLTRHQLWHGLVLRAESPELFVPWLDRCEIVGRADNHVERVLYYGDVAIRDRVRYTPQRELRYDVPQQNDIPASRLLVVIEEPDLGGMYVRFTYDDGVPEEAGSMDAFYNEFRRSAYQEADIDTIRIIREMAGQGRFE